MAMREWPARTQVTILSFPPEKKEGPDEAVVQKEELTLVTRGLCSDHILRKLKDYLNEQAKAKGVVAEFKFGPVEWVSDKERDTIAVDF